MAIGAKIVRVKSCSSTNDLAKELAHSGEAEGTVVLAQEQTAGKGTKGRSWFSVKGKGLYCSVILYPPHPDLSLLPLLAGLAARDAIFTSLGFQVALKWPNDLVCEGKKLGGILCESGFLGDRVTYAVLGLGLNVNHEKNDFPGDIRPKATSLKIAKGADVDPESVLRDLWPALDRWYGRFRQGEGGKIVRAFQDASVMSLGSEITIIAGEKEVAGIYRGIDSRGGLMLEVNGKRKPFFSAEIIRMKDVKKEE